MTVSLKFFSDSSQPYVLVNYVSSSSLVLKQRSGVLHHSSTFYCVLFNPELLCGSAASHQDPIAN